MPAITPKSVAAFVGLFAIGATILLLVLRSGHSVTFGDMPPVPEQASTGNSCVDFWNDPGNVVAQRYAEESFQGEQQVLVNVDRLAAPPNYCSAVLVDKMLGVGYEFTADNGTSWTLTWSGSPAQAANFTANSWNAAPDNTGILTPN
jgi:hypothetical protein